ncbi:MAG: VOC family protein [Actinomycetota bacterium]|nr:VOC family protein [Actinomycetota bacterium]
MDVLSSRLLIRPRDLHASIRFYRDVVGLAIYREFGPPEHPGTVFFAGPSLLEVSGESPDRPPHQRPTTALWLQVRDVDAEHTRLRALGVDISREPRQEPWGLVEMWISDPDGLPVALVEVPADHPLRRDQRS